MFRLNFKVSDNFFTIKTLIKWMYIIFTFHPHKLVSDMNHILFILISSTQSFLDMIGWDWWSPWLLTCWYHIQAHSRSAEEKPAAFFFSSPERLRKGKHDGGYCLSGDGLHAEFVRGGGNNRCDGAGPVGDGGPLGQPCDSRVLVECRPYFTILGLPGTFTFTLVLLHWDGMKK